MQEKKEKEEQKSQEARQEKKLSETWAQDALGDLEGWILCLNLRILTDFAANAKSWAELL